MDIENLLVEKFSFKNDMNYYMGSINSYGTVISIYHEYLNVRISFDNRESSDDLYDYFMELQSNNRISSFNQKDLGVDLEIKNLLMKDETDLQDLLEKITSKLKGEGLSNACNSCNEERNTSFIKLNNRVLSSCDTCTSKLEESIYLSLNQPNNYLMGTVGALLGALVGSIVWIVIGALGFVSSIGGVAIAYAAVVGYDFFKGKSTKIKALILVFAIVFGVFFAEYIGIMIASFKYDPTWTVSLWIQQTPYLFMEDNLLSDMLPSIFMGLIFAGLGTARMVKSIFTEEEVINKLERL